MPGLFFSCASHGTSHPVQLIPTCCASAVTAALDLFQAAFFKVCLAKPIPQQAELGVQTPADDRPAASGTRWSQNGHNLPLPIATVISGKRPLTSRPAPGDPTPRPDA
jgi:hypothetical protein